MPNWSDLNDREKQQYLTNFFAYNGADVTVEKIKTNDRNSMSDFKNDLLITVRGAVVGVKPTREISDSFSVREIGIEVPNDHKPEYPNQLVFECVNDKCAMLDNYGAGEEVEIKAFVEGRNWEKDGRKGNFTKLKLWKIEAVNAQPAAQPQQAAQPVGTVSSSAQGFEDDLPF